MLAPLQASGARFSDTGVWQRRRNHKLHNYSIFCTCAIHPIPWHGGGKAKLVWIENPCHYVKCSRELPKIRLTSLDLVLHGVLAVDQKLVQVQRFVRQLQVDHLLHLVGMVEVQDLVAPVVGLGDVVQEDVDDAVQELAGVAIGHLGILANGPQG